MDVATVFKMTGLSKNLERFDCKAYSEQRCKKKDPADSWISLT